MKKILTIAAIVAASTALAVESSNTFGILRVDSTAAQTIVSVPWEGAGTQTDNVINVADVVKTANLTTGDQLYYYDGSDYKAWVLNNGAWEAANSSYVGPNGTVNVPAAVQNQAIERGKAIILVRSNSTQPFYLYGQYTDDTQTTTCVLNGLTLLASPLTIDTDLNKCTWTNIGDADEIYVPTATITVTLKRYQSGDKMVWGTKKTTGAISTTKAVIPAGQGVWYKSNSAEGSAPTVAWVQNEPAQN